MTQREPYVGIHSDLFGGMTDIGRIIRDAWALGLIPETETCRGWQAQGIEALWEKVQQHWGRYEFSVRNLPDDIRERYLRIQDEAVRRAKAQGWDAELDDDE
jgi:hypothetical protein